MRGLSRCEHLCLGRSVQDKSSVKSGDLLLTFLQQVRDRPGWEPETKCTNSLQENKPT